MDVRSLNQSIINSSTKIIQLNEITFVSEHVQHVVILNNERAAM